MTPIPELPKVRISRVFPAPIATVFAAWGAADSVQRWFPPTGCSASAVEIEIVVCGKFNLIMHAPGGMEHWIAGSFREITPNARLVIEMRVSDHGKRELFTAVTELNFSETAAGTQLDVVQSYTLIDLASAPMLAGAPIGWSMTLDNLGKEFAS